MMGTHSFTHDGVSRMGEHRTVTVRHDEDGGFSARLRVEWKYSQGYERDHLGCIIVDDEVLDLAPGTSRVLRDVDVRVEGTVLHLDH